MHADSGDDSATAHAKHAKRGGAAKPVDKGTLRELWQFKEYARAERRALWSGVAMRGLELTADLAQPWPLALVINDLLKGQ
ncbi:MAG TPA: hypothetical protein VGH89_37295, partial [Pseudonocardia sp.]